MIPDFGYITVANHPANHSANHPANHPANDGTLTIFIYSYLSLPIIKCSNSCPDFHQVSGLSSITQSKILNGLGKAPCFSFPIPILNLYDNWKLCRFMQSWQLHRSISDIIYMYMLSFGWWCPYFCFPKGWQLCCICTYVCTYIGTCICMHIVDI